MTGFKSKRAAAQAKTIDEVNWADHEPNGLAQPTQKCLNIKNCGGACFQCEYFNAEKGEMEYPVVQPAQEPVAWMEEHMKQKLLGRVHRELLDVLNSINQDKIHHDGDDFHELLIDVEKALAQPKQRPWVGLTEQEFQLIYDMGRTPSGMMEMVESMLKDKNT